MIIPINGKYLLEPVSKKKASSIILTNEEPKSYYRVAACSSDDTIKCGDIVLLDKYAGTQLEHEEKKYIIAHKDQIIAIVTGLELE